MSTIPTATTSAATIKFKIDQKVPSGAVRKGPYAVERSIDPNNVVIKRRFDEGTRPIFQREDITVNLNGASFENPTIPKPELNTKQHLTRQNSTDSSSPERYRRRDAHGKHTTNTQSPLHHSTNYAQTTKRIAANVSQTSKKRLPANVPYFADEKREKDRLRRLYTAAKAKTTVTTSPRRHKTTTTSSYFSSRQPHSGSKSRYGSSMHADTSSRARYHRSRSRERLDRRRHKSLSSERHQAERHYPHKASTRLHSTTTNNLFSRHRRSRSYSRSRSRSRSKSYDKYRDRDRDRCRHQNRRSSRDRETESKYKHSREQSLALPPTQQFIPIPVPVAPDYSYGFSTWPAQHTWAAPPPHSMAPTRFAPYPLALPPPPTYRPPHYGLMPPRPFRPMPPQHYIPPNYGAPRPNRGNYRPRHT